MEAITLFVLPGQSYNPLELHGENCEADRFRDAARSGDELDELIGLVLLDTGIRTGEMAHMNPSWRTGSIEEGNFGIRIPLGDDCLVGAGDRDKTPNSHKKGQQCHQCKRQPDKRWAPDDADWRPKTKSAQRFVPIKQNDTQMVVKHYFELNDHVVSHQTVETRVEEIAERAGIERDVTPTELRHTYGTRLANKDFTAHKIKNLMGHATVEPATHYIKLSPSAMSNTFDEKW